MKVLAVVPARGGSKRLPGKNKRMLGGKPLVTWSFDAVKGIPEVCDILVSTDDPDIARIADAAGTMVPWLRPQSLSSDMATSVDVAVHALEWYQANVDIVDGLLLLQPTSPFRRRETIHRGLELFGQNLASAIVGVSLADPHPMWCLTLEGGFLKPYVDGGGLERRSQDISAIYSINGALYLVTPEALACARTFLPTDTLPLLIETPEEALDIDTEFDWRVAEAIYSSGRV